MDPGAFLAQNWAIQIPSNLSHPCLPTQSLAQSSVPSIHMHWQVVNTGCGDDDFFLVGAEAHYGHRKLGRHAATLASSTELMYIFFAVDSMCLLPASGLLSPAFAPARRAHPATGRPVLSPLSPGAARHRGGRRAVEAGALEHIPAEGLRAVQKRFQANNFGACGGPSESDRGGRRMALSAPSCVAFLPSLGVLFRGTVRVVRSKMVEFFFIAEMDRSRRAESAGVGPVNRPS